MIKLRDSTRNLGVLINLGVGIVFAIMAVGGVLVVRNTVRHYALDEARSKTRLILDHNLALHTYFSHDLKPAIFDLITPLVSPDYFDPIWMSSTHVVRNIDDYFQSLTDENYYYKEAAVNARSPQNEADAFERAFIARLNQQPDLVSESEVRTFDGKPYFVTLRRGEIMEEGCLHCHGDPALAPSDLVKLYGSEHSFQRQTGDVISAISIRVPLSDAYASANGVTWQLSVLLITLLFSMLFAQWILYRRFVLKPLGQVRDKALQIAAGKSELGELIPLPQGRELADMTAAFNSMSVAMRMQHDNLEDRVRERTNQLTADIAQRKQVEEELRQSETRFRSLFEHSISGIALHEIITNDAGQPVDYVFLEVNRAFEEQTGLRAENIIGKRVMEVLPDTDMELIAIYGQVALTSVPMHFDWFFRPLDRTYTITAFSFRTGQFAVMFNDVTEQKRTEQALRASEARYDLATTAGHTGVWDLDLSNNDFFIDPKLKAWLGYNDDEILNRLESWMALAHPDDVPLIEAERAAYRAGITPRFEVTHRMLHKDGSIRWYLARGTAMRDKNGRAYRMVGTNIDITERRAIDEMLRKLSHALERNPSIVFITDAEGRIEYSNRKFSELTGYRAEEALGVMPRILDPAHIPPAEYEARWQAIRSENHWRGEFQNHKKSGEIYWELVSISPLRNEAGEITNLVLTKEDITTRKQAEITLERYTTLLEELVDERTAELRRSEQRFRSLFEDSPVSLWEEDLSGVKTYLDSLDAAGDWPGYLDTHPEVLATCIQLIQVINVNQATLDMLHMQDQSPLQHGLASLFGYETHAIFKDMLAALLSGETVFQTQANIRSVSLNILINVSVQPGSERTWKRVLLAITDITESKRAEAAIRAALAREVEASQLRARIIATVFHEFRTPMAIIMASGENLATYHDRMSAEKRHETVDRIREAIQRMVALLDNVAVIERAETSSVEVYRAPLNVAQFVQRIISELRATAPQTIQLTCSGLDEDKELDAELLRRVIDPLLDNAIKFSPPESTIQVDLVTEEDRIVLHIQDQGIGIPQADQSHIFNVFARARNTQEYPGIGLGLVTAKYLAQAQGGSIRFEAHEGGGTTFTVVIPT